MSAPELVHRVGTEWFATPEARDEWVSVARETGWEPVEAASTPLGGWFSTVSQDFPPQLPSWVEGATKGAQPMDPGAALVMDALAGCIAELNAWVNADKAERELRAQAALVRPATRTVASKRMGLLADSFGPTSLVPEHRAARQEASKRMGELLGEDTHPGRAHLRVPPAGARPEPGYASPPMSSRTESAEAHGVKDLK